MKMKKSTDDLMKILRSTPSVDEYFDRNDSEIFFGCIDYFRKISSFFCLDDQIDISFFNNNNKCLCFTISHEGMCFAHNDIIKDLT